MAATAPRLYGGQSATAPLRRVLVRPPHRDDAPSWRSCSWHAPADPDAIAREHDALCALLEAAGAEVVRADGADAGNADAIYAYDPVLISDRGAILLNPGKDVRRREPAALAPFLEAAGVPVAGRLEGEARAEGGDMLWLDERTLVVGLGYRTDAAAAGALARLLPDDDVLAFDMPHFRGPGDVLHLMSFLSPLADDLALVYPPLAPVRLLELLRRREIELVEVPEEEFETMGCNVLALAPRVALALDGNPRTRARLERAGVDVRVYAGDDVSRKGDGGPTCLTKPLLRA